MSINMVATLVTFAVGLGIRFFLTPFIVGNLGAAAYGFIGLSANILSYTQLITIALNSMAGRFITISYIEGKVDQANKYFASVFYSNIILSIFVLLFAVVCVINLEYLIEIPAELVSDVKLLFGLLTLNSIISLMTGVWATATFIKNRLDLSNIRGIIGNILNAGSLIVLFAFFTPHIWYVGFAGLILTLFISISNFGFSKKLTPDLIVQKANYEFKKVKELLLSGLWNVLAKLGDLLDQGFDLLFANIFIGAVAMGYFSMAKALPFIILSLFQTIASVFAPVLTQLYAEGKKTDLEIELNKTIRILGLFTSLPIVCLYVFGDSFYNLWLPSEDGHGLHVLTILGTLTIVVAMPLEALWNIFTITNKLKYSTLTMFANSILTFSTVLCCMFIFEDAQTKLIILASVRSFWGIIRSLTFLPMYGAYCLQLPKASFYPPILKTLACFALSLLICLPLRWMLTIDSWWMLIAVCSIACLICLLLGYFIILTHSDKEFLVKTIRTKLSR